MTKGEVSQLVAVLMACYPNARVPDGTVVAYENFLEELDQGQASRAVANVVRSSKFFPTIAEVVTAYEALTPPKPADYSRYLGPKYSGKIMGPRELHAEISQFLARPEWAAQPVKSGETAAAEAHPEAAQ